jgi:hypothetical protein
LLSVAGIMLLLLRIVPAGIREPLIVEIGFAAVFLMTIALANSGYAGVRHALPIYPACAMLAGATAVVSIQRKSPLGIGVVSLALIASVISAIPNMRPWEYRNEVFGGAAGAYRMFSDEGLT